MFVCIHVCNNIYVCNNVCVQNCLHVACENGHLEVVKYILSQVSSLLDVKTGKGVTTFMHEHILDTQSYCTYVYACRNGAIFWVGVSISTRSYGCSDVLALSRCRREQVCTHVHTDVHARTVTTSLTLPAHGCTHMYTHGTVQICMETLHCTRHVDADMLVWLVCS